MKSCNWSCISQVRWWIGKGTEAIKDRGRYTPTGRCFQRLVLAFEWFDMFWCCNYIDQPSLEMLRWSMFIGCLRFPWKTRILTCVSSIAMLSFSSLQNLVWSHGGKIDHLGTNLIYSFSSHSLIFRGTRWLPSRNVGRSIKPSICMDRVDRMWSKWRSFKSSQSLSFTVGDPLLKDINMSNHNWALSLMLVSIEWKLYLGLVSVCSSVPEKWYDFVPSLWPMSTGSWSWGNSLLEPTQRVHCSLSMVRVTPPEKVSLVSCLCSSNIHT